MTDRSRATTHAEVCWSWGPAHYECAVREIKALLEERDALRRALSRILENEASDYKAAEEFGGYVLDDELREEAREVLE